ncbi:hypothetical protein P154DRAFT_576653 [Amniculicola lignicola CBS 123094]|uniref:F-box domain-containing protein n=1 Tax=Amniculicola lignicola CBS 123094 TaxID=1392246 RepID=A0A6A5WE60_9PLEO|nr:hypothetical protein P154DRAFT_576653 [Amniculicola lignicola CBS 123094]
MPPNPITWTPRPRPQTPYPEDQWTRMRIDTPSHIPALSNTLLLSHYPDLKAPVPRVWLGSFPPPIPPFRRFEGSSKGDGDGDADADGVGVGVGDADRIKRKCLFTRLPTELVVMIVGYADDALSVMALRASCVRFAGMLADPVRQRGNVVWGENWRREYTRRRREFVVGELCWGERGWVGEEGEGGDGRGGGVDMGMGRGREELVCIPCLTTHSSNRFSTQMKMAETEVRKCLPWSTPLHICQHATLPLSTIKFYKAGAWCGKPHGPVGLKSLLSSYITPATIFQCLSDDVACGVRDMSGGGRGVRVGIVGRGVDEEGRPEWWRGCGERIGRGDEEEEEVEREIVIRAEIVLLRISEGDVVEMEEVLHAMNTICEHVEVEGRNGSALGMCPHLKRGVVERLVRESPYIDCPTLNLHGMDTIPCSEPSSPSTWLDWLWSFIWPRSLHACGMKYYCPHAICNTHFYFYRARYAGFGSAPKDELVLCVVRTLGPCWEPWDKRWMVQVVDEESGKTGLEVMEEIEADCGGTGSLSNATQQRQANRE